MPTNYDYSDPQSGEIPDFLGGIAAEDSAGIPILDTLESTDHVPPATGYRAFLISGMLPAITKADRLYERLDQTDNKHRLFLYRTCHTSAAFLRHKESGKIRIGSNSCKLRFCPLCQRTKKAIITANVKSWIAEKKKPKFITLTLKHSDEALQKQIDRLYKSFKDLRRAKLWKDCIKGGIWFFQIKKSKADDLWHPHLHICCHGKYIDKFELSKIWKGITNDSEIVDVKKIDRAAKAAEYVGRYAAEATDTSKLDDLDLFELAQALSGRRICGTFGTAKGLQLSIKPPADTANWERLESFDHVFSARDYEPEAAEIWRCWKTGERCLIEPKPPAAEIAGDEIEKRIKAKVEQMLLFGKN